MKDTELTVEKLESILNKKLERLKDGLAGNIRNNGLRLQKRMFKLEQALREQIMDVEVNLAKKIESVDEKLNLLEEIDVRSLQARVTDLEKQARSLLKSIKSKHG